MWQIQFQITSLHDPKTVFFVLWCTYLNVTWSGELGNKLQQQLAHLPLVGINSAGYFYLIQSELSYLKVVQLSFDN